MLQEIVGTEVATIPVEKAEGDEGIFNNEENSTTTEKIEDFQTGIIDPTFSPDSETNMADSARCDDINFKIDDL